MAQSKSCKFLAIGQAQFLTLRHGHRILGGATACLLSVAPRATKNLNYIYIIITTLINMYPALMA